MHFVGGNLKRRLGQDNGLSSMSRRAKLHGEKGPEGQGEEGLNWQLPEPWAVQNSFLITFPSPTSLFGVGRPTTAVRPFRLTPEVPWESSLARQSARKLLLIPSHVAAVPLSLCIHIQNRPSRAFRPSSRNSQLIGCRPHLANRLIISPALIAGVIARRILQLSLISTRAKGKSEQLFRLSIYPRAMCETNNKPKAVLLRVLLQLICPLEESAGDHLRMRGGGQEEEGRQSSSSGGPSGKRPFARP